MGVKIFWLTAYFIINRKFYICCTKLCFYLTKLKKYMQMEINKTTEIISEEQKISKFVRIAMLLDIYGGLLTEKQKEFVELHYEEDYSFGEISQEHGVSRQAVHDAVKHAEKTLENYEEKLQILEKINSQKEVIEKLNTIKENILQNNGSEPSRIIKDIDEVIETLEKTI